VKNLIFNTHDIILLATIYQSLLFALLIMLVPHKRHKSDIFLIGFLITQAFIPLHLLINYGDGFKLIALNFSPNLYRVFEIAYWLEGPILLWYTRSLVYKDYRLSRIDLLFLAPAALYLVWVTFDFYALSYSDKYSFLSGYDWNQGTLERHLTGFARELLRAAFSVMCLIDIRHCRQQIRKRYSNADEIDFGWLNFLVIGFLVVRIWAVLVSVAILISVHTPYTIDVEFLGLTGNYTVFILVSALIFRSISQSSLFEGIEPISETKEAHPELEKVEIDPAVVTLIETHMTERKPFLANILTLDQLAKQLQMSSRSLSNVINRHYNHNFFEFVNHYRVEEAKQILANPDQSTKTMIEVMADCGFNSKATFNTFFKKMVGSTPSQYRNKMLGK